MNIEKREQILYGMKIINTNVLIYTQILSI